MKREELYAKLREAEKLLQLLAQQKESAFLNPPKSRAVKNDIVITTLLPLKFRKN